MSMGLKKYFKKEKNPFEGDDARLEAISRMAAAVRSLAQDNAERLTEAERLTLERAMNNEAWAELFGSYKDCLLKNGADSRLHAQERHLGTMALVWGKPPEEHPAPKPF
jgi:hypothetical protein